MSAGAGPQPRPATAREREVLHRMLDALGADADALRPQIDDARISGGCDCGCPTIYLAHPPAADGTATDVATASVTGSEDFRILFVSDGRLDQLEYVAVGEGSPDGLPAPDLLGVAPVEKP